MMLACTRAEDWIERRRHLSDLERLALEEHVEVCERCRGYAAFVDEASGLLDRAEPPSLTSSQRARILARVRERAPEPRRARARWPWLAAPAVALACAAAFFALREPPASAPIRERVAPIGAGEVELAQDAVVSAGHAEVRARERTLVRFDERAATLHVLSGAVEVDVDHGPRRPFVVRTPRFSVQVLGTGFVVRQDGVDVLHGAVRIVAIDGTTWVPRLTAGSSWRVPAPEPAARVLPPPSSVALPAPNPPDVTALLARARALLAERRAGPALRAIRAAIAAARTRAQAAEARSLLAEHALVSGDPERAVDLYLAVGRTYRDLPAGDNAFFAAVRLRARRGPPSEARTLIEEYRSAYPDGRFHREAARRLEQTEGADDD